MGLLDQFNALSDQAKQYTLNKLARFGNGVGDTVAGIPGNANRLAQGLLNLPQTAKRDMGGLLDGSMNNKLAQVLIAPQQANPQQWIDAGMELSGMAPLGGLLGMTKKADGLLGAVDNAGMNGYSVKSIGSQGHQIIKDGVVVGTVRTGKAKEAIPTFIERNNQITADKLTKREASKQSAIANAARKKDIDALNSSMSDYKDIINSAHKNQNLEFNPLPDGIFGSKGNPLIHQSPSYGKKPGSSYRLVMVDGKPAYARESDHWGQFSTNDFVNGEMVSNSYNWPLNSVDTKPYGDIRRAGYVFLDDLIKK